MDEELITEKEDQECLPFPPCPEKPHESDCCGSGCSVCVFDIYNKQLLEWKQQIVNIKQENKTESTCAEDKQTALSQKIFLPFKLLNIQQHTNSSFLYTFQAIRKVSGQQSEYIQVNQPLEIKVGQYLVMKGNLQSELEANGNTGGITRAYTPILDSKSNFIGQFRVLIKLYKEGKMSSYLTILKEKDTVFWKGPYGNFNYVPNSYQSILMLCAGTGIAPMFNIVRSVVKNENDETFIWLLFACKNFGDILLRQKLQQLASYWNFSAKIFLSCAQESDLEDKTFYQENIRKCKINREIVINELNGKDLSKILVLVCGTKSFNKDMINYVKDSGISDCNIFLF